MKQLLLSLLTFFLYIGCTENRVASKLGNTHPDIFPDYKGISIPINIAPLNFTVRNSSHIKAVFSNNNQPLFSIEGKNKIDIPLKKWQHMLSDNTGKQIDISISVWNESYPEGIQYKSFPVYITTDSIDPYIAYRLIEPGYESWHEMDIRQRALNCFKEDIIISSNMNEKDVSIATHSAIIPLQSSCFMHGLLREGQSLLKITSLPKCNYRNSDHPKKELIPTGIHLANISFFQPIPPVSLFIAETRT